MSRQDTGNPSGERIFLGCSEKGESTMNGLVAADGLGVGVLLLAVIAITAYLLPWIIAASRKTRNRGTVAVLNVFLGWTFLGWVIALAMAFGEAEAKNA